MKTYYVYQYKDPITNIPFYIGNGTGGRMFVHLSETREKSGNILKHSVIQRLRNNGYEPIVEKLFDGLLEEEAYDIEAMMIRKYGRIGIDPNGILTNRCEDNRPPRITGAKHHNYGRSVKVPDENKRRESISKAKKGKTNGQLGLKKSDNMKKKLSISKTGVLKSEITKKKLSEINTGSGNPNFGTMWITDGSKNKKILKTDTIAEGWKKGRVLAKYKTSKST